MRPALVWGWAMSPSSSSAAMSLRTVAGRDAEPVALDQGLGADRLVRGDVVLHDRAEDGEPAVLDHAGLLSWSRLALTSDECQVYKACTVGSVPVEQRSEDFQQVAERVWVARHAWMDVNVTVVLGERGVLVVDTARAASATRAR